jgi:hypothetical protein
MVGLGRFELPTLGLGNQCSIHLSYSPIMNRLLHFQRDELRCPHAAWVLDSMSGWFRFKFLTFLKLPEQSFNLRCLCRKIMLNRP